MRILYDTNTGNIIGTATDQYSGSASTMDMPEDFDVATMHELKIVGGVILPKAAPLEGINAEFEAEMLAISSLYPPSEREGWPNQQTEANAFLADPQASTPILDAIVAVSGEAKADLAANIVAKVAAYSAYYGAALGRKRKKIAELPA